MNSKIKYNVYLSERQAEVFTDLADSEGLTRAALFRKIMAYYFQQHGYEWPGRVE